MKTPLESTVGKWCSNYCETTNIISRCRTHLPQILFTKRPNPHAATPVWIPMGLEDMVQRIQYTPFHNKVSVVRSTHHQTQCCSFWAISTWLCGLHSGWNKRSRQHQNRMSTPSCSYKAQVLALVISSCACASGMYKPCLLDSQLEEFPWKLTNCHFSLIHLSIPIHSNMNDDREAPLGVKMLADHLVKVKMQYEGNISLRYQWSCRTD